MKTTILFTLVAFLFVGCATDAKYDTTKRSATTQLDIFRDGAKPSRAYKEIAMLNDEGRAIEQVGIEKKFMKKAKRIGGNAIVFYPLQAVGAEPSGFFAASTTYLFRAIVVVYE